MRLGGGVKGGAKPDLARRFTTGSVARTPFVLPSSATGRSHLWNIGGMAYTRKPTPERKYEPKHRKCLRCHAPFMSEWLGERICGKCKASKLWRQGMLLQPLEIGRRR